MPSFTASAPGKVILFGEHAVVYGQPAIAVPVMQVRARATLMPNITGSPGKVRILAPDVGLDSLWEHLAPENPIGAALRGVKSTLGIDQVPACTIKSGIYHSSRFGTGLRSSRLCGCYPGFGRLPGKSPT